MQKQVQGVGSGLHPIRAGVSKAKRALVRIWCEAGRVCLISIRTGVSDPSQHLSVEGRMLSW